MLRVVTQVIDEFAIEPPGTMVQDVVGAMTTGNRRITFVLDISGRSGAYGPLR